MKVRLFAIALLILFMSHKTGENFKIVGQVDNVPDGTQIFLVKDGTISQKDTIINGHFEFTDSLKSNPTKLSLLTVNFTTGVSSKCNFWANNSLTKVRGSGKYLSGWNVSNKTEEQKTLNKFQNPIKDLLITIDSVEQLRVKNINNRSDGLYKHYSNLKDSLYINKHNKEFEIIKTNYNNKIALEMLYNIVRVENPLDKKEVLEVYQKMESKFKNTLIGEGIYARTQNLTFPKVGDRMVDLKLKDVNGEIHKLSEYEGKYILLNFWAASCSPTVKAIPFLNNLQINNSDILTIIGISLDDNKKTWKEAINNYGIQYLNLTDEKGSYAGASIKYGAHEGSPYYFLIDKNGLILENWFGYGDGILQEKLGKHIDGLK